MLDKRHERAKNAAFDEARIVVKEFVKVMRDYPDYSDEYEYAKHTLRNHDELVAYTYQCLMWMNKSDIRFCGKKFLKCAISVELHRLGY